MPMLKRILVATDFSARRLGILNALFLPPDRWGSTSPRCAAWLNPFTGGLFIVTDGYTIVRR